MIGAEGARLLKNATAFFSCVGVFEEAIQCPAGAAGQVRPRLEPLRRGGSPQALQKGSILERKSITTCLKATKLMKTAFFLDYPPIFAQFFSF